MKTNEKYNWEATANHYKEKYEAKCKEYDKLKRLAEKIALECYIQTELKYELLCEKHYQELKEEEDK